MSLEVGSLRAVGVRGLRGAFATALVLLALGACSRGDVACARADAVAREGRLAEAARLYAGIQRQGPARCADEGSAEVADRTRESFLETARGRAEEDGGDHAAARRHYEEALEIDTGNAAALAGFTRVAGRSVGLGERWVVAQRLHDEGLDAEAREEIVRVLRAHPGEPVPGSLVSAIQGAPESLAVASAAVVEPLAAQPRGTGGWWPRWLLWVLVPLGPAVLAGVVLRVLRGRRPAGRSRDADGPGSAAPDGAEPGEGAGPPDGAVPSPPGPPADPPPCPDALPARVEALAARIDELTGEAADLRESLALTDGTLQWLGSRLEHQEKLMTRFHEADPRP